MHRAFYIVCTPYLNAFATFSQLGTGNFGSYSYSKFWITSWWLACFLLITAKEENPAANGGGKCFNKPNITISAGRFGKEENDSIR